MLLSLRFFGELCSWVWVYGLYFIDARFSAMLLCETMSGNMYIFQLQVFFSGIKPGFNGLEVAGLGIKLNKVRNPD